MAMRYSVLGGGKRLRPVLCLMATEACGGDSEAALPAACALEMVHTYSLIHDDLPAMDNDDLRRGRATNHRAFDEATAILAGDGLLTLAFEVVAKEVRPSSAALRCVAILAEAAGPAGMVAGQMADLLAEGRGENGGRRPPTEVTLAALEAIHRRKTGALLCAPLKMGAVIAQASEGSCCRRSTAMAKPSGWRSRSSTTCWTFRVTKPSWASASVRIPNWENGRTPGFWESTAAAAEPGNWPTRRSRLSSRSAPAASSCETWRWLFWKGIVDEPTELGAGEDQVAGRFEEAVRSLSSSNSPPRCAPS